MCLADAETYLQADAPVTINVTNVTDSSQCDVIINEDDVDFDTTRNAFYYYLPEVGSIYFNSEYIGGAEPVPEPSPEQSGNDNDHPDDDNDNDHSANDNDRSANDNDRSANDNDRSAKDNDRSDNDNDKHKRSRRHYRTSSHTDDGDNSRNTDTDRSQNDNDHTTQPTDNGNNSDSDYYQDWDNWNIYPLNFTIGNTTFCVNKTQSGSVVYNDSDSAPTPAQAPVINYTLNGTAGPNGTTVNTTTSNGTFSSTVIGSSDTVNAIQNDPNNQFIDEWGNDARHIQIRDDMINSRTRFENQLDNLVQQQNINTQRQTDVIFAARQNIIKVETTFLFPQGATEDDKNKTCVALVNTAESFSDLTYERDCDITELSITGTSKRQNGDYLMFTTYSINSDVSDGGAVFLSIFAFLIALTCNLF